MENGGNAKVNAIFEGFLNVAKPTQSANGQERERFIRDKYERRKFYDAKAFDKCSQMVSERGVDEVVSDVNQRRLSASRTPSDAARKRVEERAARTHASPRGSATTTIKSPSTPATVTKSAPSPAPAVDLLDFGDFDSVEATSAVHASGGTTSSVPQASPNSNEPALDLFANMTTEDIVQEQQPSQSQQSSQPQQKKMTADDIMSMFNTPAVGQQNPMFPSNGINGMHPQQMAMMNGMVPPQQQQMGGMMNGMMMNPPQQQQMGGMMNGGMMNPQQQMQMMQMNGMNPQQQMQMMQMQNMMGQMNMGMLGGQGMGGSGGNNNMTMMQQQQQGGGGMPQMNAMTMGQQAHNMMGHQAQQLQPQQQQQEPSKQQQQRGGTNHQAFADFASFGR